ncbi:hypothetical protein AYL99_03477 [Fonsecaea erecta]|uniref:Uncharacterized protein n=1 Tax=Fonsecaea erecta TaxID=1367422 RepID=A0A178ZPH1_9EURO|nr:hypothetical protein AYL99_03477 [Fonsecaea erecta]OAP61276.1 hypothetical protein AYL99_03477 [Fonsecaea erecta]
MGRLLLPLSSSLAVLLLPGVLAAGLGPNHNLPSLVVTVASLCAPGFFIPAVSGYVLPAAPSGEKLTWRRDSLLPRKHEHTGHKNKDTGNQTTTADDAAAACMASAMEAAVNQTGIANVTEAVAMSNTTMSAIASACAGNSTDLVQAVAAAASNETAAASLASTNGTSDAIVGDGSSSTNSSSSSSAEAGTGDGSGDGNGNNGGDGKGRGRNGNAGANTSSNDSVGAVIDDVLEVVGSVIGERSSSDDAVKKAKRDSKYRDNVVRKKWVAGLDERAF